MPNKINAPVPVVISMYAKEKQIAYIKSANEEAKLNVPIDSDLNDSGFLNASISTNIKAPLTSRMDVNDDASINSLPSATRHRIEFAANANIAAMVSVIDCNGFPVFSSVVKGNL